MQGEFWGRSQMVDIGFVDFSEVWFFLFFDACHFKNHLLI